MVTRRRLIPWYLSAPIVAVVLLLLLTLFVAVVNASFDASNTVGRWLSSNYVAGLVVTVLIGLVVGVVSACKKGLCLRIPVPRMASTLVDDRSEVISREQLADRFNLDASVTPLREDGWLLAGEGKAQVSTAAYRSLLTEPFCISAQFRPLVPVPQSGYWRAGFLVRDKQERPVALVHIDSHNLLVAEVGQAPKTYKVAIKGLAGQWSLLALQVGARRNPATSDPDTLVIYGHLDAQSYFLGEVSGDVGSLDVEIRAWSDTHKAHHVQVRDVSLIPKMA